MFTPTFTPTSSPLVTTMSDAKKNSTIDESAQQVLHGVDVEPAAAKTVRKNRNDSNTTTQVENVANVDVNAAASGGDNTVAAARSSDEKEVAAALKNLVTSTPTKSPRKSKPPRLNREHLRRGSQRQLTVGLHVGYKGPTQHIMTPGWVTSVSPLQVMLVGKTEPIPASKEYLQLITHKVGDRVQCRQQTPRHNPNNIKFWYTDTVQEIVSSGDSTALPTYVIQPDQDGTKTEVRLADDVRHSQWRELQSMNVSDGPQGPTCEEKALLDQQRKDDAAKKKEPENSESKTDFDDILNKKLSTRTNQKKMQRLRLWAWDRRNL